jgi:predicted RNA-binding Zn-ribbon protein involved in translation (DUF1610 family)
MSREDLVMGIFEKVIIAIAIVILVVAIFYDVFRWLYFRKYEHFQCPSCGFNFKTNTLKLILSGNSGSVGNTKMLKCPHCGKKEVMKVNKD